MCNRANRPDKINDKSTYFASFGGLNYANTASLHMPYFFCSVLSSPTKYKMK